MAPSEPQVAFTADRILTLNDCTFSNNLVNDLVAIKKVTSK